MAIAVQQRPWNEPWLIATHEAAHAVYDLARGATIIELWSNGREGHCHAQRPTSAAGCLSGFVGEWNIDRPGELPTADDFRDNMNLTDVMLAAKRLGSDDPDRLLACWIEAKAVIDAHWPAVERVALALWTRGRLSGEECVTLWRARSIAA
jgi:hypothetical protein